jgi:LemA protein
VRDFNTKIAVFPSNILAGMFNFKPREFFEIATATEREAPKVSFGNAAS